MKHKIFLGKYRVAAAEAALAATEPASDVPVTEQPQATVVYHGEEIDSGRDVAIEQIPAASFKSRVRDELEAEAIAAKKINHINIPAVYDFGVEDDHLIYVTEYLEGTTAEEWVNEHGPMPVAVVMRIALQVVAAMGASAFHRISHHAINPGNLMLVPGQTPEGDWPLVKVMHFVGVAPTIASADTSVASFDKGSHYSSPEQLRGSAVDFRSEIYSLGATMWFLLTGAPPLVVPKGPLAMQPTTMGLAVDKLSGLPKKVRRLLAQMLSVDPDARPQDPLAFYRQIQDCLAQVGRRESMARRFGMPLLSNPSSVVIPARRRFSAKTLALAALFLLIAGVAAVMLPSYLRHQRVRQAEEPIGVTVGVPEPVASRSAVVVQAPPAAQTNQASSDTSVANANTTTQLPPSAPAAPPKAAEPSQAPADTSVAKANNPPNPLPTAAPDYAPATTSNEVAMAPVQPADTSVATTKRTQEPPKPPPPAEKPAPPVPVNPAPAVVAANQAQPPVSVPPTNTRAEEQPVARTNEVEPAVTAPPAKTNVEEPPAVAANNVKKPREVTAPSKPIEPVHSEKKAPKSDGDTEIASNVPTARPVAREVRRAEPVAPGEGFEEETRTEPVTEPGARRVVRSEEQSENPRPNTERIAKTKRPTEKERRRVRVVDEAQEAEAPIPRDQHGRMRARFIGVTPEGDWMFSLPSKKIVVMPPPPGG